jgi:DNA-binding CsgD family transcriptional regulator
VWHTARVDELVGRNTEFAAIRAALRRPDLAGAVFVGDAGVGKSHLLQATLRHAEEAGFVTVSITGSRALGDIPLAAFASMLPGRPSGDAGDLVQIRRALQDRAGTRPLLLGLDDAHLLDEASAALAHQLASDLTAFVVGTLRTGEVPPEAISALMREGLAARIPVDPLDAALLGDFARVTLGAPVSADVADQLYQRTLGNPLFARELLLQARSAGVLVERDGVFGATGPLPAPSTLTQFVDARLASLGETHQRAVALVGIGGPIEIELLEQLVDPDALVELETARLLTADERDDSLMVGFVHPVYADAARKAVGRLAARQMLRELADALERRPVRRPQDVLRIATWRLDGGSVADPQLLADATRIAAARHDHDLAERLGLAWFDQVAAGPQGLRAALRVASAYIEQGEYGRAIELLGDPRVDRSLASPADRLRGAVIESNVRFWAFGEVAPAIAMLDGAIDELGGSNPLIDAAKAAIWASAGEPMRALELAPPGSEAARLPAGVATDLLALSTSGRPAEALERLDADIDFHGVFGGAITGAAAAFAMVEAGRVRAAAELALDGWEHTGRSRDRHGQVAWAIAIGWTDLDQGKRRAAEQWFERAAELAAGSAAAVHGTRWALGGLLLARALDTDGAGVDAVVARLAMLPPHEARAHGDLELRGRAWLRAMRGDIDGAVDDLLAHADEAERRGRTASRVRFLLDIARLDRAPVAWQRLSDAPAEVDGELLPRLVDAIRGFATRDVALLAATADALAEAGYLAYAAECAAGAWTSARDRGDEARAVAQLGRRAQELRDGIDAHATPALTQPAPEITLSRREREIAQLVAEGRTSREVADELIIGVRTVESHLARVYAKLGVRSRTELVDALGLLGSPS